MFLGMGVNPVPFIFLFKMRKAVTEITTKSILQFNFIYYYKSREINHEGNGTVVEWYFSVYKVI